MTKSSSRPWKRTNAIGAMLIAMTAGAVPAPSRAQQPESEGSRGGAQPAFLVPSGASPQLVAPDAASFAALIDRSIAYRPTPRGAFRPFVVSQLGNGSPQGTRSLQKLGVMRALFGGLGFETPGLVVRQFPGDQPSLKGADIW